MKRFESLISIEKCIKGRVYQIRSRNLALGVWNGKDGFIGIRTKFGSRYLFTEYHYDTGAPYGTVYDTKDLNIDVPNGIEIREVLDTVDKDTKRPVKFDIPIADGGRGWYFIDTNEANQNIHAVCMGNDKLFDFLIKIEENNVQVNSSTTT